MKKIVTLIAVAVPALAVATPAFAVTPDSESYVINLSGEVQSHCELVPEGSTNFAVDMLDTGNQGALALAYSCNSPYKLTLQSQNGGMKHLESNGSVNIDYNIKTIGFFAPSSTTNSANMQSQPVTIDEQNTWQNIASFFQGGSQIGTLDLSFDNINEYAVAGTYQDELTITLTASL